MNIAVLGAGAMGCLFGAKLSESGQRVVLVDVMEDHVRAINENGLTVESDGIFRKIFLPAVFPVDVKESPDLILIFTKAFHTVGALEGVKRIIGPHTWLLTLQNGIGHSELLTKFVEWARIVIGTTTFPCDFVGPGHVRTKGDGTTHIMSAEGKMSERLEEIAGALDGAGLNCGISKEVQAAIWQKAAFNAALNTLTAVTGLSVGGVGASAEGREIAARVVSEVMEVARCKGLSVNAEEVQETLAMAFREHGDHRPSMLQDLSAGRPTEIEFINGAVVREAGLLGLSVPVTETLYRLVWILEQGR